MPEICDDIDLRLGEAKRGLERLEGHNPEHMTKTWNEYLGRLQRYCAKCETTLEGIDTKAISFDEQRVWKRARLLRMEPDVTEKLTKLQQELDNMVRDAMQLNLPKN